MSKYIPTEKYSITETTNKKNKGPEGVVSPVIKSGKIYKTADTIVNGANIKASVFPEMVSSCLIKVKAKNKNINDVNSPKRYTEPSEKCSFGNHEYISILIANDSTKNPEEIAKIKKKIFETFFMS